MRQKNRMVGADMSDNINREITCDSSLELITEYIDGECSVEKEQRLFLHIQSCPECKKELKTQLEIKRLLAESFVMPDSSFVSETMKKMKKKRPFYKKVSLVSSVISVFVVAICLIVWYNIANSGLFSAKSSDNGNAENIEISDNKEHINHSQGDTKEDSNNSLECLPEVDGATSLPDDSFYSDTAKTLVEKYAPQYLSVAYLVAIVNNDYVDSIASEDTLVIEKEDSKVFLLNYSDGIFQKIEQLSNDNKVYCFKENKDAVEKKVVLVCLY